jgi:Zinc dependent phospholipase C
MLRPPIFLFIVLCFVASAEPYSVITHIAVIDSAWDSLLAPMLQKRFPNATAVEIQRARKFAYGGCIIQDLGYYPGGSKFFSDLLHYIRSGEVIDALVKNSQTPSDYAFALAALAHYASDNNGHALATNRAVPILYPELRTKFGDNITFDQKPSAHLKVEFGYDVLQVARGNYLPDNYHDFIGFDVAQEVLRKSFREIYGLSIEEVIPDFEGTIGTYRYTVTGLIPDAIEIAWELKKDEIQKTSITQQQFFFRMPRSEFEKRYGTKYQRSSFFSKIIAFFVRILPPIGPLKILHFRPPTPEVERMFLQSYERTLQNYQEVLKIVAANQNLANKDLDTGAPTRPGEYRRTDATYTEWLKRLAKKEFATVDEPIKKNIIAFYANPSVLKEPEPKKWKKVQKELEALKRNTAARIAHTTIF